MTFKKYSAREQLPRLEDALVEAILASSESELREDIEAAAILLLKIEVGGRHSVERVAQVAGNGYCLEKDLGHDHGTAQVEPDTPLEPGNQAAEDAEVHQAGLAECSAVEPRRHVHDIGADGHVDARRNATP